MTGTSSTTNTRPGSGASLARPLTADGHCDQICVSTHRRRHLHPCCPTKQDVP